MKRTSTCFLAIALLAVMSFSQTVDLCGRVTDPGGKPLTNTLVRLAVARFAAFGNNQPYYTTTDANGQYHLGTGTACNVSTIVPSLVIRGDAFSKPEYVSGKVLFSVPQDKAWVKMSLYDLAGRFVKDLMNSPQSKGNYSTSINMTGISSQFYLLHVSINGVASVILLQPLSRSSGGTVAQKAPEFQTKLEKLAAVVDTLHATEPGYTLG
ncbi:MAG TPA: carboxypeptidase-like regulatory domain-containing protein, partial [Chitinivibrionales bacterium]|nr:carboxypeptidase-like regulatory domain-containing protein [Chitinivibrionales bacterium]